MTPINTPQVAQYLRSNTLQVAFPRFSAALYRGVMDPERAEDAYREATETVGRPAWRIVGESVWHPGPVPGWLASGVTAERGILPLRPSPSSDEHPRSLDGEDYPDDQPMPRPEPVILPLLHWSIPAAVIVGATLFWIFK